MFRLSLIVLGSLLFLPAAQAASPSPWAAHPTPPATMNDRVEQAANQFEMGGAVPRVVLFDMAYPGNDTELAAMKGYGVMLVTALSQDASELPPARVYLNIHGKQLTLKRLTGALSTVPDDETAAEILGKHRWDGLYLFPVYAVHDGNSAAIDFAANRKGFEFAKFTNALQAQLGYAHPVRRAPRVKAPPEAALRKLVQRDFPGFLASSDAGGSADTVTKPAR